MKTTQQHPDGVYGNTFEAANSSSQQGLGEKQREGKTDTEA